MSRKGNWTELLNVCPEYAGGVRFYVIKIVVKFAKNMPSPNFKYECHPTSVSHKSVLKPLGKIFPSSQNSSLLGWFVNYILELMNTLWTFPHQEQKPFNLEAYARSPGPRLCKLFVTVFCTVRGLLTPRPTANLEDNPFLSVRDCLFNIFTANLHSWRPFLHSQPEDAPCCGDRDPT
jgi:hypothetical protein